MTCPVYATVHMNTGLVTFSKVPEKNTAMFNWSPCSKGGRMHTKEGGEGLLYTPISHLCIVFQYPENRSKKYGTPYNEIHITYIIYYIYILYNKLS